MSSLPENLLHGLVAHGVPPDVADRAAHLSPVSTLFAAFLGYDPVQHLIGAHALAHLPRPSSTCSPGGASSPA